MRSVFKETQFIAIVFTASAAMTCHYDDSIHLLDKSLNYVNALSDRVAIFRPAHRVHTHNTMFTAVFFH